MTSPALRLVKGPRSINLNDFSRFYLYQDFVPPPVSIQPMFAEGTSANKGGAALFDRQPVNRTFAFRVNMRGGSSSEIRMWAARVQALLAEAGDQSEPLYLLFKPDSDTSEPLWGQHGAYIRYQVEYGAANFAEGYLVGARLATDVDLNIVLVLRPQASGQAQRAGSALGRLLEDTFGTPDGLSRGLVIAPSLTNLCTNPVFGHATWNTGWTADASLTASQNTDPDYLLNFHGQISSAKLVSRAASQEFYQSLTLAASTHTFVALIMRPDKGTPSSSDVEIFYNAGVVTTTFTDLGNGLWRITGSATGTGGAANTGVQVKTGRTIYLLYYGVAATATIFYPFWGDNLGCAWSGTAHASTSTSTAGRWRLPVAADTFEIGGFTLRIIMRWRVANTHPSDMQIFSMGAASIRCLFQASDDKFQFTDGTNTAPSEAFTFTENTEDVFHFVAQPGTGLIIYRNGVSTATSGTYTPPTLPSYLYLGTNDSAAAHAEAVFRGLDIWAGALSATEVANDYANVAATIADDQRVGAIPWLWTKDGDNIVDNVTDSTASTGAPHDQFCVVGGVPGSAPAMVMINGLLSSDWPTITNLWLGILKLHYGAYFDPETLLVGNSDGTADVGSHTGSYLTVAGVTTSAVTAITLNPTASLLSKLYGAEVCALARLYDAGSLLTIALQYGDSSVFAITDYVSVAATAVFGMFQTKSLTVKNEAIVDREGIGQIFNFKLQVKRTSGSADIRADYFVLLPRPVVRLTQFIGAIAATEGFLYDNGAIYSYDTGANQIARNMEATGDVLELYPERANILLAVMGDAGTAVITHTLTYNKLIVTPRYDLI